MTPFGARLRALRAERGISLSAMAAHLGVSPAYLSALEHGKRGKPTFVLVQGILQMLGVIWDEADELIRLADLSDPRVVIETAGLEPAATLFANRLARSIAVLDAEALAAMGQQLEKAQRRHQRAQARKPAG